jgi:hypothetical protein
LPADYRRAAIDSKNRRSILQKDRHFRFRGAAAAPNVHLEPRGFRDRTQKRSAKGTETIMLKTTKLALAAFLVAGVAGTAIAAEKAPKRPADVDLTITQTIPAEDAGAPRLCDPRESDAGRCANPAAAPKSPYPVNALQGLNLGF